ncbi:MAG: hypothetical protein ACUVWA_09745 [Candidatus Oleimicrobiaceae bacterium]
MNSFRRRLLELSRVLTDEEAAYAYLLQRLQRAGRLRCQRCGSESFYLLSRYRLKCRQCRSEFRPLASTVLSALNLPLSTWLSLINDFALTVPPQRAAARSAINYKTALRAYNLVREAVLSAEAQKEARDSLPGLLVIGIVDGEEQASVELLEGPVAQKLVDSDLARVRKGIIAYTERYGRYDTVVMVGERKTVRGASPPVKAVDVDYLQGFWHFAKHFVLGNRAVTKRNVFAVLKELEWRYNNRDADLFDLIVDRLLAAPAGRGGKRRRRSETAASY